MAYFQRTGESAFRPTGYVSGAWDPDEQHIAPALGLLAHAVERDRDLRRSDGLVIARLPYDILGTIPLDVVETAVTVIRPGRTIELVEATLGYNGHAAVRLRTWLMQSADTTHLEGTSLPRIPQLPDLPAWNPSTEVRRAQTEPGRASFWVRTPLPLIQDEEVSQVDRHNVAGPHLRSTEPAISARKPA